jgi:cell division protein FtsL
MTGRVLLTVLVLISSLQVVITRHDSRKLFVELQALEAERDLLLEDWGRLQIEQATWATHGRIESKARGELDMVSPDGRRTVVVAR